jgi:hypothetical protein
MLAQQTYTGETATRWRKKLAPPKLHGCSFKFYMHELDVPTLQYDYFSLAVNTSQWVFGPLLNPSMNEFGIHEVLVQSPCRTSDPAEADAFYIPFPASLSYLSYDEHTERVDALQEWLAALPDELSLSVKPTFGVSFTEGPHLSNSFGAALFNHENFMVIGSEGRYQEGCPNMYACSAECNYGVMRGGDACCRKWREQAEEKVRSVIVANMPPPELDIVLGDRDEADKERGDFDFEAALASGVSFRDVIVPYLPNPELVQV